MGVGSGLYMYDVVVKRSRSLSHLLMSSCHPLSRQMYSSDLEIHLIHASLGPPISSPNGISIGLAIFASQQTHKQTDRPTDHAIPSRAVALVLCNACDEA